MDKNEPNHKIKMGKFYKANNSIRPKELSLDGERIKKIPQGKPLRDFLFYYLAIITGQLCCTSCSCR